MQTFAYSVYDNKALVYGLPFFGVTDGFAVRAFTELANDLNTTVGRHPSDFSLFCVGSYEDQTGALVPLSPLRHVIDANSVLTVQPRLPLDRPGGPVGQLNGEALERFDNGKV